MAQEATTLEDLKAEHDRLLASKPEGLEHDAIECEFCEPELATKTGTATNSAKGGDMSTYTEDELQAAIAAAVKPVQDELASFKASQEAEEVEARIAEAKAEAEEAKAEVEKQLDTVTLERDEAVKAKTELEEYLAEEAKKVEEAAAFAAKRDERVAQVKEVASFSDEHIEASADRWTAMADEDFAGLLEDWKAVAAKKEESGTTTTIPAATAMTATRDDGGSAPSVADVRREVMGLRSQGVDTRTIH